MTHIPEGVAAGSAPRVRPRTVSAVLVVLLAAVVLQLLLAGLALADAVHSQGLIDRAADASGTTGPVVSDEHSFTAFSTAVVIMILVAVACYHAGFAVPLSRGRNYARIAVWAGVGVPLVTGVFCGLGGLLFRATSPGRRPAGDPAAARFYEELDRRYAEESPVWIDVSTAGVAVLLLLSLIVVVVLLATPSSSRYYGRARPVAAQSLPPYAYPLFPPLHRAGPMPVSPPGSNGPAAGRTARPGGGVPQ